VRASGPGRRARPTAGGRRRGAAWFARRSAALYNLSARRRQPRRTPFSAVFMPSSLHTIVAVVVAAVITGCGDGRVPDAAASSPAAVVAAAADGAGAGRAPAGPAPAASATVGGSVRVRLTGGGADVEGDFPTTICAGFLGVDAGVAYQVQAGEW